MLTAKKWVTEWSASNAPGRRAAFAVLLS